MAREEEQVGGEVESIGVAEARSALAWWLEAGVDIAVQEQPRDWLKPAPKGGTIPPEGQSLTEPVSNLALSLRQEPSLVGAEQHRGRRPQKQGDHQGRLQPDITSARKMISQSRARGILNVGVLEVAGDTGGPME